MTNPHAGGWRSALEFATHVVSATVVLCVIAMAALGLGEFGHYALDDGRFPHAPWWIAPVFKILEGIVFFIDVLTYVAYVVMSAVKFVRALF